MNSIWNKNKDLFIKRFPSLAELQKENLLAFENALKNNESSVFPYQILNAKNGEVTALEGTKAIHSKYDPTREAVKLTEKFDSEKHKACVFFSFGLGYGPNAFAEKTPESTIILIEPEPFYFFTALTFLDWEKIFAHGKLILALDASKEECTNIFASFSFEELCPIYMPSQNENREKYFKEIHSVLLQKKQTENINTNTLEKFSTLWLRNSTKNIEQLALRDGVIKYKNTAPKDLPFIILAAGPSLKDVLPYLKELKQKSVLICVDTALHACLKAGVEPDFIILVDPQYYCAKHLDFLSSPGSVLITESAVYPSVFRFNAKEIVLCSSLFPLGQYFEKQLGTKGSLGSGGSVATTAWDFAYWCGASEIFIAGMDLGFPNKETHIRGSQFEQRAHRLSKKTHPSETDGIVSLMSTSVYKAKDYDGKEILTDQKMSLFSWWFEKHCAEAKLNNCRTFTLTPQSLAIANVEKSNIDAFNAKPDASNLKDDFFTASEKNAQKLPSREEYLAVLNNFTFQMNKLLELSKKGKKLAETGIKDRLKAPYILQELSLIDEKILKSDAKNAAALVFPTERQLQKLFKDLPQDAGLETLYKSRVIYTELINAILKYKKYLNF